MPCENAMITEVVTATADMTVEEVIKLMHDHNIRMVPVLEKDGTLMGVFGNRHLMKNLLPVSVTMEDGLQRLDFIAGATPGVAKRLRKLKPQKVGTLVEKEIMVVRPDTSTWEGVRLIAKYGMPLPVVEKNSGKFLGIISEQSLIDELQRIIEELEDSGEL